MWRKELTRWFIGKPKAFKYSARINKIKKSSVEIILTQNKAKNIFNKKSKLKRKVRNFQFSSMLVKCLNKFYSKFTGYESESLFLKSEKNKNHSWLSPLNKKQTKLTLKTQERKKFLPYKDFVDPSKNISWVDKNQN